jgi:hypothetical protein
MFINRFEGKHFVTNSISQIFKKGDSFVMHPLLEVTENTPQFWIGQRVTLFIVEPHFGAC